jgi:DNA-binding SARP family transcriptional activator
MTEFRLLGPLEAVEGRRAVALPTGKPSALLARLLLEPNRVVPVEGLVDALWGEHPPASANKLVQAYVSHVRKAVGAEAIETRAPGYLIRIGSDDLDLRRFETLAEEAEETSDPARRSELLGRALALWRGAPLAEFRDAPFARAARRRLGDLRVAALEEKLEAELELGRHERIVGELEALVEEEPLRERPRRQLMLALYRSGRQPEALARYREGRRLLVQELGIEPSPALQELERAILRRDPSLDRGGGGQRRVRGCVICVGTDLHELVAPLCTDGRELLLVELAGDSSELPERSARLDRLRDGLQRRGLEARTATFTTEAPAADLARLAAEQDAELLVTGPIPGEPLAAPCDVALAPRPDLPFESGGPVLVPFGGGRDEWAALELGAWLARAHGLGLRLLGVEGADQQRDASRMLAGASIALQRFAGTPAEPVIVAAGAEGILSEAGSIVVASLPARELGPTRAALVERSTIPLLFVRGGLRPGGLAPTRTLTRFSWSLDSG